MSMVPHQLTAEDKQHPTFVRAPAMQAIGFVQKAKGQHTLYIGFILCQ